MRFRPFDKKIIVLPRFVPLRYRFIVTTAGMLVFILGALALVLGYQQSRTIKQQLEKRGLAIAQSLAAVSIADLMTYNYISLERSANQAAKHPDIIYVIFHDKEGRVAGFSGRSDLQGKFLNDKVTRNTLAAKTPLIQDVKLTRRQISALDIAVPILLPKTQAMGNGSGEFITGAYVSAIAPDTVDHFYDRTRCTGLWDPGVRMGCSPHYPAPGPSGERHA